MMMMMTGTLMIMGTAKTMTKRMMRMETIAMRRIPAMTVKRMGSPRNLRKKDPELWTGRRRTGKPSQPRRMEQIT